MYRILIVDDEKIERRGIRFLLGKMGLELEIEEAPNGLTAYEYLQVNSVDLLFTDVKMPFMNGIELIEKTIQIQPQIKMVIFSGFGEFEYAKHAMLLGVQNYILKPVDPKEFNVTVGKMIGEIEQERLERELSEKNRDFMNEHYLYSLVNGKSIERMDFQFLDCYHRVFLIEFNYDFFGKEGVLFLDFLKKSWDRSFMYLNLTPQQSILLLDNEGTDCKKLAWEIHNLVEAAYETSCYIAVSKRIEDVSQICSYYKVLESLMENKFYQVEGFVFLEDESTQDSNLAHLEDDTWLKKIKQDIKMKDMDNLKEHYQKLCDKYYKKSNYSQVYIKFIFSNLLKEFYEALPSKNEIELTKTIDKLYESVNFTGILEIVNRMMEELQASFVQNPVMVHRKIEAVKQYVYENYSKELGVEQLSDWVCLAPSYLSHIFNKDTGQNLSKFIKAYRMEKAKEMLGDTHNKIVDISNAVGYHNVSYFCQSFREHFGMSPQKFRTQGEWNEEADY